jgi:hypothetical protein
MDGMSLEIYFGELLPMHKWQGLWTKIVTINCIHLVARSNLYWCMYYCVSTT